MDVSFDYWYGESDSHDYIEPATNILKAKKALYESDGAMVVDVSREDDKKDIPPIIIFKSDGSAFMEQPIWPPYINEWKTLILTTSST